jgi:hypothetical protein
MSPEIEQASKQFMQVAEKTNTLYAMSDEYLHLLELLEDPETVPEEVEAELDRISGKIAHKSEAIAGLIKWYQGLADMRSSEAKRMADSVHRFEGQAERLKAYLLRNMQQTGMTRIDTGRFTLSVKQNPPRVEVLEAAMVPSEYQRTKVIIDVDKRAVTEHWKATGEIPPGVEIVRAERLDIR